jgi:hypothetical protein
MNISCAEQKFQNKARSSVPSYAICGTHCSILYEISFPQRHYSNSSCVKSNIHLTRDAEGISGINLCPKVKYARRWHNLMEFKLTRRILVNKFANHTHNSVWETLAQRIEIACISVLFEAYTGETIWKSIEDTLKGPCYLSRDDHDRKIKAGNEDKVSVKK